MKIFIAVVILFVVASVKANILGDLLAFQGFQGEYVRTGATVVSMPEEEEDGGLGTAIMQVLKPILSGVITIISNVLGYVLKLVNDLLSALGGATDETGAITVP